MDASDSALTVACRRGGLVCKHKPSQALSTACMPATFSRRRPAGADPTGTTSPPCLTAGGMEPQAHKAIAQACMWSEHGRSKWVQLAISGPAPCCSQPAALVLCRAWPTGTSANARYLHPERSVRVFGVPWHMRIIAGMAAGPKCTSCCTRDQGPASWTAEVRVLCRGCPTSTSATICRSRWSGRWGTSAETAAPMESTSSQTMQGPAS